MWLMVKLVVQWGHLEEIFFYVGSEVGQSCGLDPKTSQHHLLPSLSFLSFTLLFVVWLSLLQVGPLTLSQMEFCFSKRHKTPEICTDYATVQIAS